MILCSLFQLRISSNMLINTIFANYLCKDNKICFGNNKKM